MPVLVVAERLLDEEAHQVERDALVQPPIGPLLRRDEAAVVLTPEIRKKDTLLSSCPVRL